jgi:hypothetical protein
MPPDATPPGLIHWHAPLVTLSPGLWLMWGAVCVALAPRGRWRSLVTVLVAVTALVMGGLLLRSAWLMESWWSHWLGGWVHAGLPVLALALVLAGWQAWRARERGPAASLADAGGAFLMMAWCVPVGGVPALMRSAGTRRWWTVTALVAIALLGWWKPVAAQAGVALLVGWQVASWRLTCGLAAGLAAAVWWWPEAGP